MIIFINLISEHKLSENKRINKWLRLHFSGYACVLHKYHFCLRKDFFIVSSKSLKITEDISPREIFINEKLRIIIWITEPLYPYRIIYIWFLKIKNHSKTIYLSFWLGQMAVFRSHIFASTSKCRWPRTYSKLTKCLD